MHMYNFNYIIFICFEDFIQNKYYMLVGITIFN